LNSDDIANFAPYLVHSRMEVASLFYTLVKEKPLVSMLINHGSEAVVTSILHFDDKKNVVIVDGAPNEELNKRIVSSDSVSFESSLDNIRILFFSSHVKTCIFNESPALSFKLPETLVRLQRRDFYRVKTPILNPIKCTIQIPDRSGKVSKTVCANVQNISAGGLSLADDQKALDSTQGRRFSNCRIDIPGSTPIVVTLQVKSSQEITFANGKSILVVGCMFVDMPNNVLSLVQRYITKLEREQNARSSGLS